MHRFFTHDLVVHGLVQGGVFATATATGVIWAPMAAAVVGAFSAWALQQLSKGLWRQLGRLELRVAELESLRCPYGQAERDMCAARPASSPPVGRNVEL